MKLIYHILIAPEGVDIVLKKGDCLSSAITQPIVHKDKVARIERTKKTRLDGHRDGARRHDWE